HQTAESDGALRRPPRSRDTGHRVSEASQARRAFDLGPIADFPPGTREILEIGGRPVRIYNTGETLYAVQNICPHILAPIGRGELTGTMLPSDHGDFEYGMEGLVLRCIWHGWEF